MNNLIVSKNEATMSSREIAELTGKNHADVLRDIRNMFEAMQVDEVESKFAGYYAGENGKRNPEFRLPKRETLILVSGYNINLRVKIIDRWQELESKEQKQLSPMEMVILSAQAVLKVEQEQAAQSKRLDAIEAKQSAILEGHGFYSILAYSKLKGVKLDVKQSAAMGKKATSESRKHGIMMGTVPDARHGTVKTYHSDILEIVFA